MTKRRDLAAVLGKPTQDRPLYFHDIEQQNPRVTGLNSGILKSPIRICQQCNSTRTQPHDRAWECMSKQLRERDLVIDRWVRANKIFPYRTLPHMIGVQLYFLKLFGCMLCEAKETGHDLGIDIATFSNSIMLGTPHPEVFLQFGKGEGVVGRSNLHAWKTQQGSLLAPWLYQLDSVAVSVVSAQAGRWEHSDGVWHPNAPRNSKRFKIADFMYVRRIAKEANAPEE